MSNQKPPEANPQTDPLRSLRLAITPHIKAAAATLRSFGVQLRVYFHSDSHSFVNRGVDMQSASWKLPTVLADAVSHIDAALRLTSLRGPAGVTLPEGVIAAWKNWTTSSIDAHERELVIAIMDCGREVYRRSISLAQVRESMLGQHLEAPLGTDEWAISAAAYLEGLVAEGAYPPDLITHARAAEETGVDASTIRRWIRGGGLPCYGNDRRVSAEELKRLLPHLRRRKPQVRSKKKSSM